MEGLRDDEEDNKISSLKKEEFSFTGNGVIHDEYVLEECIK